RGDFELRYPVLFQVFQDVSPVCRSPKSHKAADYWLRLIITTQRGRIQSVKGLFVYSLNVRG
uniref:Uncharacterized protein n=1 Tax=Dicentrarchus labrax TaxID=13489 RepID=A0A8P4G7J7_DICLA